jgi:hypothetical protein
MVDDDLFGLGLRLGEDRVGSDAAPDDMRFIFHDGFAELERRPAIFGPRHLEHAGGTLHSFHPKTLPEPSATVEIVYEESNGEKKGSLLRGR